jgi:hypothetical protein
MNSHCQIDKLLSANTPTALQVEECRIDINEPATPIGIGQVSLLWYPKTKTCGFTHVKLAVDGEVWSCHEGFWISGTLAKADERARTNNKGLGFFRYDFDVVPAELLALKQFLDERKDQDVCWQSCIGGAAYALKKNTRVRIPVLFPTFVAASLSLGQKTGFWAKEVKKMEYVGNGSGLKNLMSTKVGIDIASTMAVGAAIGEGLYYGIEGAVVKALLNK